MSVCVDAGSALFPRDSFYDAMQREMSFARHSFHLNLLNVRIPPQISCLSCSPELSALSLDGNMKLVIQRMSTRTVFQSQDFDCQFGQAFSPDPAIVRDIVRTLETMKGKASTCSDFSAIVNATGMKKRKLKYCVTGGFIGVCRHDVPLMYVFMEEGERFVYPLIVALLLGVERVIKALGYDVLCQFVLWLRNLLEACLTNDPFCHRLSDLLVKLREHMSGVPGSSTVRPTQPEVQLFSAHLVSFREGAPATPSQQTSSQAFVSQPVVPPRALPQALPVSHPPQDQVSPPPVPQPQTSSQPIHSNPNQAWLLTALARLLILAEEHGAIGKCKFVPPSNVID